MYAHSRATCTSTNAPPDGVHLTYSMPGTNPYNPHLESFRRIDWMTCIRCGQILWGWYTIEEEPY